VDHRNLKRADNEVVRGARNRLMGLIDRPLTKATGSDLIHHKPMEYLMVGESMKEPLLGLEYWVVFSRRGAGRGDDKVTLRAQSNELYVHNFYPIVASVNGQTHGEFSAKFLRDLGLPLVSKHIVIHLDASLVPSRLRRDLFSTTREGFKEGPVLTEVLEKVATILKDDEKLFDIEAQLADRIVSSENVHTSSEVKAQVVKLLTDAGWQGSIVGPRKVKGTGKEVERSLGGEPREGEGGEGVEQVSESEPFIALPFPEVSVFEPAHGEIEIPKDKARVVAVSSDASREFADRGLIALRSENDFIEIVSFSAPKGGGFQWRVRVKDEVQVGAEDKLIAALTKPNGEQLSAEIAVKVGEPTEDKAEEGMDRIPNFEVLPVSPSNPEVWNMVWPEYPVETTPESELTKLAYRSMKAGETLYIYYSTVFKDFAELHEKYAHRGQLVNALQTDYEVWTAFHAVTQHLAPPVEEFGLLTEEMDKIAEAERTRFGQVQAKQSLVAANRKIAMERAVKAAGAGE
jgi:hypothetical protein